MHRFSTSIMKGCVRAFLLSLITAALFIVPFIVRGHGILYVVDDFNLQQIPFNILSNEAIKSGNVFWNWNTDLGSQFIGAYSFYTLGSPFFWLSCLFPAKFFPYMAGPLLILKFAVAGAASYAYFRRFIKRDGAALIGSLLYAFSSFQLSAITFNHFIDVTALFPLLLLAFEMRLHGEGKGLLALMVALSAFLNYFFFVGEVVFLILYFIVRLLSKKIVLTWKRFLSLIFESAVGVGLSSILLLPSVLFVAQNPRVSQNVHLAGLSNAVYDWATYLKILAGLFMPAQVEHKWSILTPSDFSSVHAFLPLFGFVLIVIFVQLNRRSWMLNLMAVCLTFALIPVLNTLFYAGNTNYWYCRWYYMPILMMALASAKVLDEKASIVSIRSAFKFTIFLYSAFLLSLILYAADKHQEIVENEQMMLYQVLLLIFGLTASWGLLRNRNQSNFYKKAAVWTIIFAALSGAYVLYGNETLYPPAKDFTRVYTKSSQSIHLPTKGTYRTDTLHAYRNVSILLNQPAIQSFNSTVNGSIFSFYASAVGAGRGYQSQISDQFFALRPFLSVKYILVMNASALTPPFGNFGQTALPDLVKVNRAGAYTIYRSKDYIPFGFTFDHAISMAAFMKSNPVQRHLLLLKGLVLNDQQMKTYASVLPPLPNAALNDLSMRTYRRDVADRKQEAGQSFTRDNRGFTSHIKLFRNNLVFFSVPYDPGWTATVNGRPAKIENVDSGLMAVQGSRGNDTIRFNFVPQGLMLGTKISIFSMAVLILYLFSKTVFRKFLRMLPAVKKESF